MSRTTFPFAFSIQTGLNKGHNKPLVNENTHQKINIKHISDLVQNHAGKVSACVSLLKREDAYQKSVLVYHASSNVVFLQVSESKNVAISFYFMLFLNLF